MKQQRLIFTLAILLFIVAISSITGCKGGVGSIIAGDIQGPGWLNENLAADYSIEATDVVNPAYSWSVDPQSAGSFTNGDKAMATFHANEVTVNTTTKISVTITGYNANPLTVRKDVTVMDTNQAPVAAAQADKTRIGDGQQVQFRDDSTDPEGDDDIIKWEWDFDYNGDAGFNCCSELREPVETFDDPGTYIVQLRVTDKSGIVDMLDTALSIKVVQNIAPVITQVNHSRTTSETGNLAEAVTLEVVFEDYTPPGGPHEITWSCDYGYFDNYTSATPLWYPPGEVLECDITVEVVDEFGLSDSGSVHQWITSLPVINNASAPGNVIISAFLPAAFGGSINPAEYIHPNDPADGNVIFISYWVSWSEDSVDGIPILIDLYDAFASDANYMQLMTNVGESGSEVVDFVNLNLFHGPYWLLDADNSYFTLTQGWCGGSSTLPQHMLFDRDGRCRWAYVGRLLDTSTLNSAIDELLN